MGIIEDLIKVDGICLHPVQFGQSSLFCARIKPGIVLKAPF
jgi:hypothetical protein